MRMLAANYGTAETAYTGPNGDGTLDGRIIRDGTDAGGRSSRSPSCITTTCMATCIKGSLRWLYPTCHADQAGKTAQPNPHPVAELR